MAVEIRSFEVTLSPNEKKKEICTLAPAEGEKLTIIELSYKQDAAGKIRRYIGETKLDEVTQYLMPPVTMPVQINLELRVGQKMKFEADDDSGATNKAGVLLVYNREKA
jgi:hypothetical protein